MNKSRRSHISSQSDRIEAFLQLTTIVVVDIVSKILQSTDCEVTRKGQGLDMVFSVKHGEKDVHVHMHNLLLEIATVDRDERYLRFDEKLISFDYFVHKTNQLIDSKLKIIFELLFEDDFDKARENIARLANDYERIRIWEIDKDDKSE